MVSRASRARGRSRLMDRAAPSPTLRSRRCAVLGIVAIAAAVLAGAFVVPGAGRAAAADVVHVSPAGSDSASGSVDAPLRTVRRAIQLASPGDTVQIATGTYHEQVQIYAKEIHLAAAPGADVVFDGARQVTGWASGDHGWTAAWNTDFARAGAPHTTAERPEAGWPEQFFIDGTPLVEVTSSVAVVPGTFFHDRSAGQVVIGDNPTGRLVEGSDLNWAIYLNHADGSSITGITARRYATPFTNMAAIRAYADDLRLTGLTVEQNAYMGVSAIGNDIQLHDITTRNNGHLGAHAHRTVGLSVTDSVIEGNNVEQFDPLHAAGGIKVTDSSHIAVRNSEVSRNGGPGIWTDLDTTDVSVTGNTVIGNQRSGIELELSARVIVADNVVTSNGEAGVWVLETSDVQIWHNALFDNHRDIWVEDGPRDDVLDVDIVNNTMGGVGSGAPAIVNVDDWTSDRSAEEMRVALAGNRYWMPPTTSTAHLSRWADWPYGLKLSNDIGQHRSATGSDGDAELSRAVTNPYVRSPSDLRQPEGASDGNTLTSDVAAALGVDVQALPAGPIAMSAAPPPDSPETTTTTTTTPTTTPGGPPSPPRGLQPAVRIARG